MFSPIIAQTLFNLHNMLLQTLVVLLICDFNLKIFKHQAQLPKRTSFASLDGHILQISYLHCNKTFLRNCCACNYATKLHYYV